MRSGKLNLKELENWISGDPYKEALLIAEVPIAHSTLSRILSGAYNPSERLAKRIQTITARHPEGEPIPSRQKVAVG